MTKLTSRNQEIHTNGSLPSVGSKAPDFKLIDVNLKEVSLADFKGKKIIFNIMPSVDTHTCSLQLKRFSKEVSNLTDVVLLFGSLDLPFAYKRFCAAEGIDNAVTASDYLYNSLDAYGVKMQDGPLKGLYARAVLVLDEDHNVKYSELVKELSDEPDYQKALAAL